jgi:hypothetical protein
MKFENINEDCASVLISFLWPNYTREELLTDIDYYISWHRTPDIFINCAIHDIQLDVRVPSPYRKNTPFRPRRTLRISPWSIWSPAMKRFMYWLSKDKVRKLKTYKRCVMRWVSDVLENRKVEYYVFLHHKILKYLTPEFFRGQQNTLFQEEVLQQIASCPL